MQKKGGEGKRKVGGEGGRVVGKLLGREGRKVWVGRREGWAGVWVKGGA